MQSEPHGSAPGPPVASMGPPPRAKYRLRFQKAGVLRLVSHHDLMHCFERMFRRAALSVPTTKGFNPRPRLWFAQSLALGVVGLNEVLELELTEPIPPDDLRDRLAAQCPPGLAILAVKPIDVRASAHVRRSHFRIPLAHPIPDLPCQCAAFLAKAHHWIERTRPRPRRLDIRPFVSSLAVRDDGLAIALWVTPYGAVRPDEVADALGLGECLAAGAILERTDLELADETTDGTPLPAGLPMRPGDDQSSPNDPPDPSDILETPEAVATAASDRQAPRPTPIVTGPLSFDT